MSKCNFSAKFIPLIHIWMKKGILEQEMARDPFLNPKDVWNYIKGLNPDYKIPSEVKIEEINAKKTYIPTITNSIRESYIGRSQAESETINNFKKDIIECSRLKINFNTGEFSDVNANNKIGNTNLLNWNILKYKEKLINTIRRDLKKDDVVLDETSDLTSIINSTINTNSELSSEAYDAFVILSNFDKLIQEHAPFIKIDEKYLKNNIENINKYSYVGAKVHHFSGWSHTEFADSMDQASMLVKAILDYVPEVINDVPISNSSIGLSGFYSCMTAMRDAYLYEPSFQMLEARKELKNGVNADFNKLIDAYLNFLNKFETKSTSQHYLTHITYLKGKLEGIKKYLFNPTMNSELQNIFKQMFYKNVQIQYVGYEYDSDLNQLNSKDLKGSFITKQTYQLLNTAASNIYKFRSVKKLFESLKTKWNLELNNGYTISIGDNVLNITKSAYTSNLSFNQLREVFENFVGYLLPDNFELMYTQVNPDKNLEKDLVDVIRTVLDGIYSQNSDKYGFKENFPTEYANTTNFKLAANIGKVLSIAYGANTANVVKNINNKNNLPLFGLINLVNNFNYIMWQHQSDKSESNIYKDSFLFESENSVTGELNKSIVMAPSIRSEVVYNGILKNSSQLTAKEVFRLSLINDFYNKLIDKNSNNITLQPETFADKGNHFLINYRKNIKIPGLENKTLTELFDPILKSNSDSELLQLIYNTRSNRFNKLRNNIIDDFNSVYLTQNFKSLAEIDTYLKENNKKLSDVFSDFKISGINFYEEIHCGKYGFNPVLLQDEITYNNFTNFKKRMNDQIYNFVQDLHRNHIRFNRYTDKSIENIAKTYSDWVDSNGNIILFKNKKLHPVLNAYFLADNLLSHEYTDVMLGGVYAHPGDTESKKLIAQIKRTVIPGATQHSFAQGLDNGVSDEINFAVMDSMTTEVRNPIGDTDDAFKAIDGSGLSTALQSRIESNSLLDARTGYDKKTIGHDIDSKYGRPTLLKWAVYAMTNARRRISFNSKASHENLTKKCYSGNISEIVSDWELELNNILNGFSHNPCYKDWKTGKHYLIDRFEIVNGILNRVSIEINNRGLEIGDERFEPIKINTLYDLDLAFGGAWSETFVNNKIEYAEYNVDALENFVTKYPIAKKSQIAYLVDKSAIKVGAGNVNPKSAWNDDTPLSTISMKTRYLGVQMDAEHELEDSDVTEMTQMISALSQGGYTSELVNEIYTDIGKVIDEALYEYKEAIDSGNNNKIYQLLGKAFIDAFSERDKDTLGLAQAFVLKATEELKKDPNTAYRIPFSANTVSGIFISTISSMITKKGIRRKYDGFAGVLSPSFDQIQFYKVMKNGVYQTIMFDSLCDYIRSLNIDVETVFNDNTPNNLFNIPITQDKIDFEDTVIINGELIYIDTFEKYDNIKHLNLNGTIVYLKTLAPRNLKGANVKFRSEDGREFSIYDLDSVRDAFYYKSGKTDTIYSDLELNPKTVIQDELRRLKRGELVTINGELISPLNVQVIPAEAISGRYHAKQFMIEPGDQLSDIMLEKAGFFSKKLRAKYDINNVLYETNAVFFGTENFEVVITEDPDSFLLNNNNVIEDKDIIKINNEYYLGEDLIAVGINAKFISYFDKETGLKKRVILSNDESIIEELKTSEYFDSYRMVYDPESPESDNELIRFNEYIDRKAFRMWKSFQAQQNTIGTRIPTQSMPSFMPMTIIGWTDSTINDLYVPVNQLYLQGSDLDIDKGYVLGMSIDNNGDLYVGSNLFKFAHEYTLDEIFELDPPNRIKYEIGTENSYFIDKMPLTRIAMIRTINSIMKSNVSSISFSDSITKEDIRKFMIELNAHTTTKLSSKAKSEAIKNKAAWKMMRVTKDVENQIIAQISVDESTKALKSIAKNSTLADQEKNISYDNPFTKFMMQVQNMVGKEVIGITAVSLKQFFAKTAYYQQKIIDDLTIKAANDTITSHDIAELLDKLLIYNPILKTKMILSELNFVKLINILEDYQYPESMIRNIDKLQSLSNRVSASSLISALLSLATDNAKELALPKLNATTNLADIYTYLFSIGTTPAEIGKIMISPEFNYIAAVSNGDLFSVNGLLIEDAIKFYLTGHIPSSFDIDTLAFLTGAYRYDKGVKIDRDALINRLTTDVDNIIKRAISLISNREQYLEYAEEARENMIPFIASQSDIINVLDTLFLYEDRNKARTTFGTYADDNLQLILNEVLPAVEEQQILGAMAGINQGLRTNSYDKYRWIKRLESYVHKRVRNDLSKKYLPRDRTTFKNEWSAYNKNAFNFYTFITNLDYQKYWIVKFNELKASDNILEIIINIPHYSKMLEAWAIDEQLIKSNTVKINMERAIADNIKSNVIESVSQQEYSQIQQYVSDILLFDWITKQNNFKVTTSDGKMRYKSTWVLDATPGVIELKDLQGIASFKRWMELEMIPFLKERYKDNEFFKHLDLGSSENKVGGFISKFYKLPFPMMDIDKSPTLERKYNECLLDFSKVAKDKIQDNWTIGDLMYLYNMITHKDAFNQNSLTRIFENLVNSETGYLVNSFNEWLSLLDAGYKQTPNVNIDDVKVRISKYVPNSTIKIRTNSVFESDFAFDFDSMLPEYINETESERRYILENDFEKRAKLEEFINNSGTIRMTPEDYDSGEFRNELLQAGLSELDIQKMKSSKAYIWKNNIYFNQNADISDAVHEYAHVFLLGIKSTNKTLYWDLITKCAFILNTEEGKNIAQAYSYLHGSDLIEEVVVNKIQMYLDNKISKDDKLFEVLMSFPDIKNLLILITTKKFSDITDYLYKIDKRRIEAGLNFIPAQQIIKLKSKLVENNELTMKCD